MADMHDLIIPAMITDLLWTPVLTDQIINQLPNSLLDPGFGFVLSSCGESLGLFGSVYFLKPEFSADGGFMYANCFSYFCVEKFCFQKRVNMVSLVVGKL